MWIFVTLFSTVVTALENVYQKRSTLHFNAYLVVWAILAVSSILYLPVLLHVGAPTTVGALFWPAVIARVIVDSAAFVIFTKALGRTHLSLAIPMMSFQPVFLLFVSLLLNHLFPSPVGILGIVVVVAGVYYLNFDRDTKHLLSPFQNIAKEKGVQLMLLAALLWSIVVALERLGIDNSNVPFYTSFFQLFWAICFTPLAIASDRQAFKRLFRPRSLQILVPIGVLDALQVYTSNFALSIALPVYVTAVQSTSILFAALFGFYFFQEKIHSKLLPTLVVITGVVLIAFSQF